MKKLTKNRILFSPFAFLFFVSMVVSYVACLVVLFCVSGARDGFKASEKTINTLKGDE